MNQKKYTGKELGKLAVNMDIDDRLGELPQGSLTEKDVLKLAENFDYEETKVFNEYLMMTYWLSGLFSKEREVYLDLRYSVAVLESISWTSVFAEVLSVDLEKNDTDISKFEHIGKMLDNNLISKSVENDALIKKYRHFVDAVQKGYSFILMYNRVLKFLKDRYEVENLKKMVLTETKLEPINDYKDIRNLMLSTIEMKPKESQELARKQLKTLLPPLKTKKNSLDNVALEEFKNFFIAGGSFRDFKAINLILGM